MADGERLFDEDTGVVFGLDAQHQQIDDLGQSTLVDANPRFPNLDRYCSWNIRTQKRNLVRYFENGQCSDDGHPVRGTPRCAICFATSHWMRDCPDSRCAMCFLTGHMAYECSHSLERAELEDVMIAGFNEALDAEALVRCIVCCKTGVGHKNCAPPPELPVEQEELVEEPFPAQAHDEESEASDDEDDDDLMLLDEIGSPFACWSEPMPGSIDTGFGLHDADAASAPAVDLNDNADVQTNHLCNALGSKILRLLAEALATNSTSSHLYEDKWRKRLTCTRLAALARAARDLWTIGAIMPASSRSVAPTLTALGSWLAPLPLPPSIASALLHGALWGVLLPMAVIAVLLESAPPDMALSDGVESPRRSDHYALATSYFRWREGRQTDASRRLGSDLFWETVDQRVVAVLKHAQQALGYDGDDAAFEEMDGELMDVRRRDGRPWTVASALGGETSDRWARLRAAFSAAFPPQSASSSLPSRFANGGGWVARTSLGDGTSRLDTAVGSPHALLFAAGELRPVGGIPFEVEVARVRGTLCGGEGASEEAQALRSEYRERVAQALEGGEEGRIILTTMDTGFVRQVLHYLQDSAGEILAVSQSPESSKAQSRGISKDAGAACNLEDLEEGGNVGDLEDTVLEFLSRHVDEVSDHAQLARACASSDRIEQVANGRIQHEPASGVCRWGEWRVTSADPGGGDSPAPSDDEVLDASVEHQEWLASLAYSALLQCLKSRAVRSEDYCLAANLKVHEAKVKESLTAARSRALAVWPKQRERTMQALDSRKRKAVEEEDYHLAAKLKRRQQSLEAEPGPPGNVDELEQVCAEKSAAVAAEDFDRAAMLRARQSALEAEWERFDSVVAEQAACWAVDGARRSALTGSRPEWASAAGDAEWAEAAVQLRAELTRR